MPWHAHTLLCCREHVSTRTFLKDRLLGYMAGGQHSTMS